jgi:predicted dienelactone hydrolase
MMNRREILALLCLGFVAITARAAGIRELLIPPDQGVPRISARLWTPCAAPAGPIPVDSGTDRLTIQGVKDCAPTSTGLALIVISHGMFGDMFDHYDTAEFLADAGFAVVTFNHTLDSLYTQKTKSADNVSSFLARPVEVRRVIDFLLGNSQLAVDIDSRRIGFFGFSRGGYTGLVLAGAVPNFHAPPFPCPEEFFMCKQIRNNEIPDHGSGYEPRIKAFVIADPVSFFPDRASLRRVTTPIQLWSSEQGGMGVRPEDVASVAKNLPHPSEFHRVANAGHFAFLFPCSDEVAKERAFVCTDPPGYDRAAFHKKFNAQVLEFFRKNLLTQQRVAASKAMLNSTTVWPYK